MQSKLTTRSAVGISAVARSTVSDIGGRPQADIPDDKFADMSLQPFAQSELFHIQRLRLRHRADDRMKRFPVRQRMNAVDAGGKLHEPVIGQNIRAAPQPCPARR